MSSVVGDEPRIEVSGLTIDSGDMLEMRRSGVVLRDSDSIADVVNNGTLRIHSPAFSFAGEAIRFTGNGTMELGIEPANPGYLAALDGGRIINGPDHTLITTGYPNSSFLLGQAGSPTDRGVALTNEGRIVVDDYGLLRAQLNQDTHLNAGTIHASGTGRAVFTSDERGTFRNRGVMSTTDRFSEIRIDGLEFANDPDGVVRTTNRGTIFFARSPGDVEITNGGLIEAADRGWIRIWGKNIRNDGSGAIRAKDGGTVVLANGIFRPDPSIQVMDYFSTLEIGGVFENEGNALSGGPGILRLGPGAHIRGGELTNGAGKLVLDSPLLENVTLSGTTSGGRMKLKGAITIHSRFNTATPIDDRTAIEVPVGDATLQGSGVSTFGETEILANPFTLRIAPGHQADFEELRIGGNVASNGILRARHISVGGGGKLLGDGTVVGTVDAYERGTISPGDGIGALSLFGDCAV